jgi:hypothetical protein
MLERQKLIEKNLSYDEVKRLTVGWRSTPARRLHCWKNRVVLALIKDVVGPELASGLKSAIDRWAI